MGIDCTYVACHGGGEYDIATLRQGWYEQLGKQVCTDEIDSYSGFVSIAGKGEVLAHDPGIVDECLYLDAFVVYATGKCGDVVERSEVELHDRHAAVVERVEAVAQRGVFL